MLFLLQVQRFLFFDKVCKMAERKDRPGLLQSIKELILCLFWVLYYWIIAIVKSVLPASIQGKDVSGETVLVTGAGNLFVNILFDHKKLETSLKKTDSVILR